MKGPVRKVKERPAETAGGIGGLVVAIGAFYGLDPKLVSLLALIVAALPGVVSYVHDLRARL